MTSEKIGGKGKVPTASLVIISSPPRLRGVVRIKPGSVHERVEGLVKVLIGPPLGTPTTIKRSGGGCGCRVISRITPTQTIGVVWGGANALGRVDGTFPIGVARGGGC